jgi:hypothetical protein
MKRFFKVVLVLVLLLVLIVLLPILFRKKPPEPGTVLDEARQVGRTPESFPAADEDYFKDMDSGVPLVTDEVKGRNNWIVWTGGNDRFWDVIGVKSVGTVDLLKTLSSYPGVLQAERKNRWQYLGLVNEPCFDEATGPDPNRYGLRLDKRRADCPPDPFENEQKYPGVEIGARGKNIKNSSFYGYATGIVGLRLFPNPAFDDAAAKKWDAERYYKDPEYYNSKDLVRPYRVGMSCGFCHVGPNPVKPPDDPENPKWENLSSNVGAQYFWIDRILDFAPDEKSFVWQLFHTSRPGALDTSLVSTDNINNPRTMNAVYDLPTRLNMSMRWGKETLAGGGLNNKQFNDFTNNPDFTRYFLKPDTVFAPRVLKDGSDSVGALGALNRVYINIGLFSEEWLLHFNALVGGKETSPIKIADAEKNSAYWQATEQQTFDLALFFLKTTAPHKLADAPNGKKYLDEDAKLVPHGKEVFAERCARCHSSKQPEPPVAGLDPTGCSGKDYLDCWNRYWAWTKTDEYKNKMRAIVKAPDFLEHNYLSTEARVPVTLLQTNACSPLATNAIANNIWDNFSSQTYKDLPSVGKITYYDPLTGEPRDYQMPAGGRGYTRPASLISLWSTAPFLLNNSVGKFEWSPSVDARMSSFQNSIEQMLWPEKRDKDPILGDKIPGLIDRTTAPSYLNVAGGYLPDALQSLLDPLHHWVPWLFGEGGIQIGPIPKNTPVDLLANLDVLGESTDPAQRLERAGRVVKLLVDVKEALKKLPENASNEEATQVLKPLVPQLMELSKCPDFVVNRGHYFGTSYFKEEPGLSDDDKRALIAFLKTF